MNIKPTTMYRVRTGHTKASMRETINARVPEHGAILNNQCRYRLDLQDRSGCQCCFVGAYMPDDHPGTAVEGGLYSLLREHPDLAELFPLSPEGMHKGQMVHDSAAERDRAVGFHYSERAGLLRFVDLYCLDEGEEAPEGVEVL